MSHRAIDTGGRTAREVAAQPAPILDWVAVDRLVIDDAYQRPLQDRNWQAIERIADKFCWARFAPVLVAPLEGGRFAVIDGQHRVHAAALCGVQSVPAMIVAVDRSAQAMAFAGVNGSAIRITALNLFKARLAAGDPLMVRIDDLARAAGCRVMPYPVSAAKRKPGELLCVGLLERIVRRGDAAAVALGLVLSGLLRSGVGAASTECWAEWLIAPAVAAVAGLPGLPHDLAPFWDAHDPRKTRRRAEIAVQGGATDTVQAAIGRELGVQLREWMRR